MGNWTIEVEWEPGRWRPVAELRDVTLSEAHQIMYEYELGYIEPLRLLGIVGDRWKIMAESAVTRKPTEK